MFEVTNPTISNNTYTSADYYAWENFGSPLVLYINDKVIKGECVEGGGEARFEFEDGSSMYAYDLELADKYGDITYIKTKVGWVYLAVVVDLYNREVIGYEVSRQINTELVKRALANAIGRQGVSKNLVFHSDRGSQYASKEYPTE